MQSPRLLACKFKKKGGCSFLAVYHRSTKKEIGAACSRLPRHFTNLVVTSTRRCFGVVVVVVVVSSAGVAVTEAAGEFTWLL